MKIAQAVDERGGPFRLFWFTREEELLQRNDRGIITGSSLFDRIWEVPIPQGSKLSLLE